MEDSKSTDSVTAAALVDDLHHPGKQTPRRVSGQLGSGGRNVGVDSSPVTVLLDQPPKRSLGGPKEQTQRSGTGNSRSNT
jgi:hypothetical protein